MTMDIRNAILSGLARHVLDRISPLLTHLWLPADTVLRDPGQPPRFVDFPESAIVSVVTCAGDERRCCIGLYGYEGFGGLATVLGASQTINAEIVQLPGYGYRIAASDLDDMAAAFPELRSALLRYAHVFMTQVSYTALSNGAIRVEQRLARWLLMFHDRSLSPSLVITHQRLSDLLGVRRSGVTDAVHILEGRRLIRARRGMIEILDRKRLERLTGGSYGPPELEYRRIM